MRKVSCFCVLMLAVTQAPVGALPQASSGAATKSAAAQDNPAELGNNPLPPIVFPRVGLRNGVGGLQSGAGTPSVSRSDGATTQVRPQATFERLTRESRDSAKGPFRFISALGRAPLTTCRGISKTTLDAALRSLGACEGLAREQLEDLVHSGCISKIHVQKGDTLTVAYEDSSSTGRSKKARRAGYQVSGYASYHCTPWAEGPGVRLFLQESGSSTRSWSYSVVRVSGSVIIDSGEFSTRYESAVGSSGPRVLRVGTVRFYPRQVGANPYNITSCSLLKKGCGVWRKVDISWEGLKAGPVDDPTLEVGQEWRIGFSNEASIALRYSSKGAIRPMPNATWLLTNSFYGERYGRKFSAEVTGTGPALCDWRESDYPQGQGYVDRDLVAFVGELHRQFPEVPASLPIDYDLAIREASCRLCDAHGSCSAKAIGEID